MQYNHPNVESRVVDNSFVAITGGGGATALFAPIFSSKGKDNVMQEYSEVTQYIHDFGEPNLAKYGQAGFNVAQWLKAKGRAYILRLLPEDATYSNLHLSVGLSGNDGSKEVTVKAVPLKENHSSVKAIETKLAENTDAEVQIATFIPKGRGKAYDDLGIKIDLLSTLDATYDFRTYNITIYEKNSVGDDTSVEGPFIVSFYPDAKSRSQESLYFADVLNKYSSIITVVDNRAAFEVLAKVLAKEGEDPRALDIIGGQKSTKPEHAEYSANGTWKVAGSDSDATDFNRIQHLKEGSDGTLDDTEKEKLLGKAFDGLIDSQVTDTLGTSVDVILDANYSNAIKAKAAELASTARGDCMFFADVGFQGNVQQTLDFRKEKFTVSDRNVALFAQHGEVFDTYSGSYVKVTSTYILASKIPSVDNSYGVQYPFVGPRRGTISGVEKFNFFPNSQEKENLYNNKVNYIERDPRKINFGSQVTTQAQNSALSDISHVRVLLKIKREAESICRDYRLEFNNSATHDSLSYELNNYLAQWVANGACTVASASVSATEYQKLQRIASVVINLTFTGILERIQLDLVVNR